MSTCSCGRNVSAGGHGCDRCEALSVLGLTHGASNAEIKDAYRTLAKVWHPDRFQSDHRLKLTAEEKLKEINYAYQSLTSTITENSSFKVRQSTRTSGQGSKAASVTPPGTAKGSAENTKGRSRRSATRRKGTPPAEEHGNTTSQDSQQGSRNKAPTVYPQKESRKDSSYSYVSEGYRRFVIAVLMFVAVGVGLDLYYGNSGSSSPASLHRTDHPSAAPPSSEGLGVQQPQQQASGNPKPKPLIRKGDVPRGQRHDPAVYDPMTVKSVEDVKAVQSVPESGTTLRSDASEYATLPYFTIGSTKGDVVRVQGTPSRFTDSLFGYGLSEVYFREGRVQSWRMYPSSPLKARLLPSAQADSLGYFTVGSSKDEVLAVQGTPSRFTDNLFGYGLSEVYFKDGRVQSWRMYPSSPLKARLLPSAQTDPLGYFTVGSSKDEVLAVQGTPSRFTDSLFGYGLSEVYFKDGRVQSWRIYPSSPLKARMPEQ